MKFHIVSVTLPPTGLSRIYRFVWQTTRNPQAVVIIELKHGKAESVKLYPAAIAREMYLKLMKSGRRGGGDGTFVWDTDRVTINDDLHMALRMLRLNAPGS